MSELLPAIPAATLILMRHAAAGGPPEILMLERSRTMAFAAGALVFPGGRVDDEDHAAAEAMGGTPDDAAARIAAIRETIEESGLAPALTPQPDTAAIQRMREALVAGAPLSDLASRDGFSLDLEALTPFARWRPNFPEARRFDTLFYLAEAPPDAGPGSAHAPEAERIFWASAAQILDDVAAGRARAIFPTRRNLERLAGFDTIEAALADARARQVRLITPWVEARDGRDWLCIPDGLGYPVTAEPLDEALRG